MKKIDDIRKFLGISESDGNYRVKVRERKDLEFKQNITENDKRKALKAVSAMCNNVGGRIIFGISDSPRSVVGVVANDIPDESSWVDIFSKYLSYCPDLEIHEHKIDHLLIFELLIKPIPRPPCIFIKNLAERNSDGKIIAHQGMIYFRHAGQSRPATQSDLIYMLEKRDDSVRNSIIGLIERAQTVGFDNVAVADLSSHEAGGDNVTLYVPEQAAEKLNVVDRGRLVSDQGAPAYELKGGLRISTYSDKDPRKPLLPKPAARVLRAEIQKLFGPEFPWTEYHLRKATSKLGFWDEENGDNKHTARDELTNAVKYLEKGRLAVLNFARQNPADFVDSVGSKATITKWESTQSK